MNDDSDNDDSGSFSSSAVVGGVSSSSAARPPKTNSDDWTYCHSIARRAVARAALHLGIATLTAESLDTLAGCLLEYLERLGKCVAHSVEASGRTSQHCNVMDILHATELVGTTNAAVHSARIMMMMDEGSTTETGGEFQPQSLVGTPSSGNANGKSLSPQQHSSTRSSTSIPSASWYDLAAFCFGADWDRADAAEAANLERAQPQPLPGAGKVGPSSATTAENAKTMRIIESGGTTGGAALNNSGTSAAVEVGTNLRHGWVAPYPDELPAFPLVSQAVANPHALPLNQTQLHSSVRRDDYGDDENATDLALTDVPDSVFTMTATTTATSSEWGRLGGESTTSENALGTTTTTGAVGEKRKKPDDGQTPSSERPPAKRVRIAEDMNNNSTDKAPRRPSYIPAFYPPFPTSQAESRTVVVDTNEWSVASAAMTSKTLRSSTQTVHAAKPTGTTTLPTQSVRSALVQLGPYWGSLRSATTADSDGALVAAGRPSDPIAAASIVPLARASGSRVSRILEGSMDLNPIT